MVKQSLRLLILVTISSAIQIVAPANLFGIFAYANNTMLVSTKNQDSSDEDFTELTIARIFNSAMIKADASDPAGFLMLYKIATNENIFGVHYREEAENKLNDLLDKKTKLWIKTFAPIMKTKDFNLYMQTIVIVEPVELPNNITYKEFFEKKREKIINDLSKLSIKDEELQLAKQIILRLRNLKGYE